MLTEKGKAMREKLLAVQRTGKSSVAIRITFKKGSKSGRVNRFRTFHVISVTSISFLLVSRRRVYPRNGNTFLIEDVASISII